MHAAKIYAENYANAKKSQVNNTWRSHQPTANSTYQQLSAAARLFAACVPLASADCKQHLPAVQRRRAPVRRLHSGRTHQPAHNR